MPLKGGDPLRDGEDVLVLGHRPEGSDQLTTSPPYPGGALQDHQNFQKRVPRTDLPGIRDQEKGNCMPHPPSGGGRDESILRGNGMLGEEAGESPRELFVHSTMGTPKWGTGMGRRPPKGRRWP